MNKILTILFLTICVGSRAQLSSIVERNDTIFNVNPSTGEWTQINQLPFKTINGNIIQGTGNLVITGSGAAWGEVTGTLSNQTDLQDALNAKEASILAGTTAQYWRGDKSWQALNAAAVGLGNVTNESKATMFANPTFTGTVSGVTASMVGLGNVNNTSDADKPVSTATQTALNAKASLTGSEVITNKTLGAFNVGIDAGSNDTYVVTLSPAPAAYATGLIVILKANTANTGAASVNVNSLGAKTIVKRLNTTLANSDILAGMFCYLIYDGTNFVILNPVVN